jgi:hypothetical protein
VLSTDRLRLKQNIANRTRIAKAVKQNKMTKLITTRLQITVKRVRTVSTCPQMVTSKIKRELMLALKKVNFYKEYCE